VEDDGKGFDLEQAGMRGPTEKGLGLATMEERAWMLGGSLDISSQGGRGTRIEFTIPVDTGEG
jgi:two-component system sensor histidine kinase UhpB